MTLILDACLAQDPYSRCGHGDMGGHGLITLTGELTTNANIDAVQIAKRVVGEQYQVNTNIVQQSSRFQGVDVGGAGDQGIMVGYACDSNEEFVRKNYIWRAI